MTDLQTRLPGLLHAAAGDPPHAVDVAAVRRRARRQRGALVGLAGSAAVVTALAVALPLVLTGGTAARETVVTPAGPAVRVSPSTGLRSGQPVQVRLTGFPAGARVRLSECATAAAVNPDGCGAQPARQPFIDLDSIGQGNGQFLVTVFAATGPGENAGRVPCTDRCVLTVTTGAGDQPTVVAVPIQFATGAQPAPPTPGQAPPFAVVRRIPLPGTPVRLLAADGAVYAWTQDPGGPTVTVTRVDPATGTVGPATRLAGASGFTFAGGALWVAVPARSGAGPVLLELDPGTLSVRGRVPLPTTPGDVATAGGLVWVAGLRELTAVDPTRMTVVRTVPVDNPGAGAGATVTIAAPADGRALWTSQAVPGGGPVPVQLRDPTTGTVIAANPRVGDTVMGLGLAAADDHAWAWYSTGMLAAYQRLDVHGHQLVVTRQPSGEHGVEFTNGLRVQLTGNQLWLTDGITIGIADATTGQLLARAQFQGDHTPAIAPLPSGQLAISHTHGLFIARRTLPGQS